MCTRVHFQPDVRIELSDTHMGSDNAQSRTGLWIDISIQLHELKHIFFYIASC